MTGNEISALEATLDIVGNLLDQPPAENLLDEMRGEAHPRFCSWCHAMRGFSELHRFRYLARNDDETPVVLCGACVAALQSDPRSSQLVPLMDKEPYPGLDPLCMDCRFRRGLRCGSKLAARNGGPGIRFHGQKQTISRIVRRDPSTGDLIEIRHEEWKPADWCDGRQVDR